MAESLNVLLLESHHGEGTRSAHALEHAGHRVHRCHDRRRPDFPCVGLSGGDCPLDGPIDVALAVRQRATPRPTPLEDGVTCALRAGIPLVVDGRALLDPFADLAATHVEVEGDVVGTCERTVAEALDPLAGAVHDTFAPLLASRGLAADSLDVRLEPGDGVLTVHLRGGDDVPKAVVEMLGVRALDAIRKVNRHWSVVDVVVG